MDRGVQYLQIISSTQLYRRVDRTRRRARAAAVPKRLRSTMHLPCRFGAIEVGWQFRVGTTGLRNHNARAQGA
eukprot:6174852-Pleurochrysis_carterae.AAC.1